MAAIVRFAASHPVETTLAISDGQNSWPLHYGTDNIPQKGLPVVGMGPNRTHHIRVLIKKPKADHTETVAYPTPLTFTTPDAMIEPKSKGCFEMIQEIEAAVLRETSAPFQIETLQIEPPRHNEVQVQCGEGST